MGGYALGRVDGEERRTYLDEIWAVVLHLAYFQRDLVAGEVALVRTDDRLELSTPRLVREPERDLRGRG